MKPISKNFGLRALLTTGIFCLFALLSWAQDSVTPVNIDGEEIGSWLSRNWLWVAAGVVVLLLLIGILSGGSRRKKTTIVREEDADGFVRTTTTETNE